MIEHRSHAPRSAALLILAAIALSATACKKTDDASAATAKVETMLVGPENIAVVIWQRLRPHLDAGLALSVTLYETDRNFVEYHG